MTVSPDTRCVPAGTAMSWTITGSGFAPGEKVVAWVTNPGSVNTTPIQVPNADANGTTTTQFVFPAGLPAGLYAKTLEGAESHHQAIVWRRVLPP